MNAAIAAFVKKPRALNMAMVPANDAAPHAPNRATITAPARAAARGSRPDRAVETPREAIAPTPGSDAIAGATRPLHSYRGVAVTVRGDDGEPQFALSLLHDDAAHSLALTESADAATIARAWQTWAKALNLPLIAITPDGTIHAELSALGVVLAEHPSPRRKGSPLVGRRSRYGRRRRAEPVPHTLSNAPQHSGREIIART